MNIQYVMPSFLHSGSGFDLMILAVILYYIKYLFAVGNINPAAGNSWKRFP